MNEQHIKVCCICLDEEDHKDLISPCNCSGSTKYIHRDCLENWRSTNINEDNYKRCEICHFEYEIEKQVLPCSSKICKGILWTLTQLPGFLYILIQLLILLFTYLYYYIDPDLKLFIAFDIPDYSEEHYILGVGTVIIFSFLAIFIHDISFYYRNKNKGQGVEIYFNMYAGIGITKLLWLIISNTVIYTLNITVGSVISSFILHLVIKHIFKHKYKLDVINNRVKDQSTFSSEEEMLEISKENEEDSASQALLV